ncbi:MAG TPA: hydroxymethylglutaryl-CoA lyase [Stellaceae bacterium]|jgi:hydroxymethylglutaryl-CoA lyase|nr:hydroxymethylglutaryl-CoA lyase [Stellaceae bacterium]
MSDLPRRVDIHEEGPREGFQIEPGPISTDRKVALIDALSATGLKRIQIASYVNPKRVPGWADAEAVVGSYHARDGIRYTALWLNEKGLERAIAQKGRLSLRGNISLCASEPFSRRNQNRDLAENARVQHAQIEIFQANGIPVEGMSMMAAFGCNFAGDIAVQTVVDTVQHGFDIAAEHALAIKSLSLADTMAWATPQSIKRVVGAVRERWPELRLNLHLHDTRGLGLANAYAGLEMGVASFDASVAGLGGCPFAGHKGAAGNVCTEDLAFMCEEMGIETGIDVEALIAAARLAEEIVGHPLPGSVMRGGTLGKYRVH